MIVLQMLHSRMLLRNKTFVVMKDCFSDKECLPELVSMCCLIHYLLYNVLLFFLLVLVFHFLLTVFA